MDELIARIVGSVGVSEDVAKSAVGIIMDFLRSEGPEERINELLAAIPGAVDLADEAANGDGGGLLGGMMGGAMAAFNKLQSTGLDLGQVQGVTSEVVDFAKEKVGEDVVNEIVAGIPGLAQFV